MKRECRHCHEDLSTVPPTEAMSRHIVGLCAPSRNEVDTALLEIKEAEKQRTRKALAYVNAQRRPPKVPYKRARLWQLGILCFIGSLLFAWYVFLPLVSWVIQWIEE